MLGAFTSSAAAQEATEKREAPTTVWYGWQILMIDGPAILLAACSFGPCRLENGDENWSLVTASGVLWAVGGPVVHGVNGEGGHAVEIASLRLCGPLFLADIGNDHLGPSASGTDDERAEARLEGAIRGALLGAVAASVIDTILLPRKDVSRPSPDSIAVEVSASPAPPGSFDVRDRVAF